MIAGPAADRPPSSTVYLFPVGSVTRWMGSQSMLH
jgi:hypothetical protein